MNSKRVINMMARISLLVVMSVSCGSIMLGAALGVSMSTAVRIIATAYKAYKAGTSIKAAIATFIGPGALLGLAVDFLIGMGVSKALNSTWAAAA